MAAILALVAVVVWIGAAAVTRHRAEAAADLGALAAAAYALDGSAAACDRAWRVADRMGVRLSRCALDGWDAVVEVTATPPGLIARFGTVSARARAGPAPHDGRLTGA